MGTHVRLRTPLSAVTNAHLTLTAQTLVTASCALKVPASTDVLTAHARLRIPLSVVTNALLMRTARMLATASCALKVPVSTDALMALATLQNTSNDHPQYFKSQ